MMHVDPGGVLAAGNHAAAVIAPEHEPAHCRWHVLRGALRVRAHVFAPACCGYQRTHVLRIAARHFDHLGSHRRRLASAVLMTALAVLANRER